MSRRIIFKLKTSDSRNKLINKLDNWLNGYENIEKILKEEECYWNSNQLQTFIKIKELIEEQDSDWKKERKKDYAQQEINKLKAEQVIYEMNNDWKEVSKIRNKISQLAYYLNPIQTNQITPLDILQAKQFPLNQIFRTTRKETDREWCNCPFHQEKTASMCIYMKENRFHCFGCGEHGDSIKAIMKLESLSYYEAIRRLIS